MKKMKLLTLVLLMLSATGSSFSQHIEKMVAIAPVAFSTITSNESDAIKLYNYVLNAMQSTQRIKVLDRIIGQDQITKEKKLQQGIDFVDGNVVKQGKQSGAGYILVSYINSANTATVKKADTQEILGYEGNLSVFFRVISVETGQVIASEVITPTGITALDNLLYDSGRPSDKLVKGLLNNMGTGFAKSPEAALDQSMRAIEPYIRKFIDKVFPLEMRIGAIEDIEDGKKTFKEIFIVGGKSTGLKENDILIVYEIVPRTIGDKNYLDDVEIGKLKVKRVNEDLVVSKILENEDRVLDAWSKNKENLKVVFYKTRY